MKLFFKIWWTMLTWTPICGGNTLRPLKGFNVSDSEVHTLYRKSPNSKQIRFVSLRDIVEK